MASPRRTIRRGLCGTVAASLAALVTACGSATPSAAPAGSTSTPKTSTPTATSSPSASATPSPSASSPSPAASPSGPAGGGGPAACATRQLRATAAPGQGTAGSVYALIRFTNLGAACTLYGYPGVSFGAGTPVVQVGLAATENPGTPRELVTLGAGGTASALLQITDAGNFSPGQCHRTTATWLKIYPPNQTAPIYLRYTSPTCAGRVHILTVGAVRPGSTAGA